MLQGHENRVSLVIQTLHAKARGVRLEKPQRRDAGRRNEQGELCVSGGGCCHGNHRALFHERKERTIYVTSIMERRMHVDGLLSMHMIHLLDLAEHDSSASDLDDANPDDETLLLHEMSFLVNSHLNVNKRLVRVYRVERLSPARSMDAPCELPAVL